MVLSSAPLPRLSGLVTLIGVILLGSSGSARANDGGIAFGGSPGLLKNHPSVQMRSEVIRIAVDEYSLTADCRFTFVNRGPACTVRMGFPDEGVGASDPDDDDDAPAVLRTPPRTTFLSFRSWVDGREVATHLIRAASEGQYWHTKTVRFPAFSTHQVRDVYTQRLGGGEVGIPNRNCFCAQLGYILHTGASWHGNIGRTEIVVTFRSPKQPRTLTLRRVAQVSKSRDGRDLCVPLPSRNTVVWTGPCTPAVSGRTLRFMRENWRPTRLDDVQLTFDYTDIDNPSVPGRIQGARVAKATDRHQLLWFAAKRGDLAGVKRLIAGGVRVNGPKGEVTPLMVAAEQRHPAIVRYLIAHGANVDATVGAGSLNALLYANDYACVKALLDGGANANSANVDGESVLMHWLDRGDAEAERVIRLLVARGADVACGAEAGETGLMRAVSAGNRRIVRLLLAKGAPLNATADNGDTALKIAKRKHRSDLVALLTGK